MRVRVLHEKIDIKKKQCKERIFDLSFMGLTFFYLKYVDFVMVLKKKFGVFQ